MPLTWNLSLAAWLGVPLLPIRRLLLRDLLVLILGLMALGLGISWWAQQQALARQAEARARTALAHLDQGLHQHLEGTQTLGALLETWWQRGLLEPVEPERAARLVMPLLSHQESVTSLNLCRADGRSLLFLRLAGNWSLRELQDPGPRARIRWSRLDSTGLVLSQEPWAAMDYDPRTRPWFQGALQHRSPIWTEPYSFYTTRDPGITYTLPVHGDGGLQGVVALDFLLDDLTALVWQAQPTPGSRCLVVDDQGRTLILPQEVPFLSSTGRREAFLQPLGAGFLSPQAKIIQDGRALDTPNRLRQGGSTLMGLASPFEGPPGIHWRLVLTVPEDDLLGSAWLRIGSGLALALISLGLAVWRIRVIAQRVVEPITKLSAAAVALGQGQSPEPVHSGIQEIQLLDGALQQAHASLEAQHQLQGQLEHSQRMETVGTLAGGIAHDVNNQLTAILGQLNLCQEILPEGHALQRRLQRAEDATLRCAQTTKALLSFSHQSKPALVQLDLNHLVQETATLLERVLGGRIRLNLNLAPELPAIPGDPVQLEQVLMNLGVNARDAMPEGGSLTLSTRRAHKDQVCLEVQDSGPGIPEAILPHIFEPFFTTKEMGKGTGLGLAMVFAILKAHHGEITAEVPPEGGARFRILLPVTHAPSGPVSTGATRPHNLPHGLAGKRILLVEDELLLRDMLADALTLARVQVAVAPDGAVAWRAWQAGSFDAIVSDHRMPDCTGLELLNRLRASGAKVPFVMISGQGLEDMEDSLSGDPHLRLLPKPFELPRLISVLEEILAQA